MAQRRRDALAGAALAVAVVAWLLAVEGRQGIGRDEAQYFRAAERYWGWFESAGQNLGQGRLRASFSRAGLDPYWGDNPEHPPVAKVLYGLSWRAFHRCECPGPERALHHIPVAGRHKTLSFFARESTAFRFPAIVLAGIGAALVFFLARRFVGRPPAAAAAVLAVAQPHYFFHAQIAAFDAPITTMAVLVAFAYWKSLRSARWGILCGPLYGIALGTKHNAWLIPIFLLAHYLWIRRGDLLGKGPSQGPLDPPRDGAVGRSPPAPTRLLTRGRRRLPRVPLSFVSMAVLGPLVLFALWPWLWPDPIGRGRGWLLRHLQHEHYNFEYLGRNWNLPPRDLDLAVLRTTFPFVSTALTVPATTLALALVGGVALARVRRRQGETGDAEPLITPDVPVAATPSWTRPGADVDLAPGAFLAIHALGPLFVLAVPSAPIFGGVKHFLPAVPFLAVIAAVGLRHLSLLVARAVRRKRARRALPAALAALVCLPAVVETQRSHPDGLGHYNFLAGGFAGGASLGMNRQFWGYSVMPMLDRIVQMRPASNAIYWHDVFPDALTMYARDGRVPIGIGNLGAEESAIPSSDLAIVIHEKHFALFEGRIWDSFGTTRPVAVYEREGVPFVTVYRRGAR